MSSARARVWLLAVGITGSLGVRRFVASFLYRVSGTDALTMAACSAILLAVVAGASIIPARRALALIRSGHSARGLIDEKQHSNARQPNRCGTPHRFISHLGSEPLVGNPSVGPASDRGHGPETANFRPVRDSGAAISRVAPMSNYIIRTARNRVVPSTTR